MTFTEKELKDLKQDILRLKDKLRLDRTHQQYGSELSVTPTANPRSNRGSKLDPTSDTVNRMKISSNRSNYKLTSIEMLNSSTQQYESKLVYVNKEVEADLEERIKAQVEHEFGSDDEFALEYDTMVDEMDDPYMTRLNDVLNVLKYDQILKPISKPSDVVNINSISSIYKEKYLENLSNETVAIIEQEQGTVNLLNGIMDVFLHDDPERILADNMNLPEYDHHLDLQNESTDSMVHAQPQGSKTDGDPFFQPPVYESDPQFDNINPEEIDETRQLLQIALQRNEEYIRSLKQIRLGFLHADNYKQQIYKWCREINEK